MSPKQNERSVSLIAKLRLLAASDPKEARAVIQDLLAKKRKAEVHAILDGISGPEDGRIRQAVATVFRTSDNFKELESWLRQWIKVEADEFTRNAIATALAASESLDLSASPVTTQSSNAVSSYRYVADRLCHRVRNAMSLPSLQVLRLERLVKRVEDPNLKNDLVQILTRLEQGFTRISRIVEFDTGDDYQKWDSINVIDWAESNANKLAAQFGNASLTVACAPAVRNSLVRATRFLLDTTFGNLWSNAVQAVEGPCKINMQCALNSATKELEITLIDNGSGFDKGHLEIAFQQMYSTRSENRGRGLLEIADAVTRMQGRVRLVQQTNSQYRLQIRLPVEAT